MLCSELLDCRNRFLICKVDTLQLLSMRIKPPHITHGTLTTKERRPHAVLLQWENVFEQTGIFYFLFFIILLVVAFQLECTRSYLSPLRRGSTAKTCRLRETRPQCQLRRNCHFIEIRKLSDVQGGTLALCFLLLFFFFFLIIRSIITSFQKRSYLTRGRM